MSQLKYPELSKSSWLQHVGKEAIHKSNHSTIHSIVAESFPHPQDLNGIRSQNLSKVDRGLGVDLGLCLNQNDLGWLRSALMNLLQHGAEHIRTVMVDQCSVRDFQLLFTELFTEMFSLNISVESANSSKQIVELFPWFQNQNIHINLELPFHKEYKHVEKVLPDYTNINAFYVWEASIHQPVWVDGSFKKFALDMQHNVCLSGIIRLNLANDFLDNIAMLRALRMCKEKWQLKDWKIEARPDISLWAADPFQNQIASSLMLLAGFVGGADHLLSVPCDVKSGTPSMQWLRTAIHTLHILKLESHLDLVADPCSGSYYLENLSNQLFQMIDQS